MTSTDVLPVTTVRKELAELLALHREGLEQLREAFSWGWDGTVEGFSMDNGQPVLKMVQGESK